MRSMLLLVVTTGTLQAAPLDGVAFDIETRGKTLEFSVLGAPYGAEQYLPGRRVIWAFENGPCREGVWFEDSPGNICFVYDYDPTPQCWAFFKDTGGLRARFAGDLGEADLVETRRSTAPLACPGPDVGA